MSKRSKRYQQAAKLVDDKKYSLTDAVEVLKKFPAPKFDATVTVSFKMGVDPRKSDQMVRGTVSLPHGTGKEVRVVVFATGDAATEARASGADKVGLDDLILEVQNGYTDFDVAIATPSAMAEVRKIARILGPRGLMPNPKTGTVTDDVKSAIKAVKAGRIDFKLDKNSNISAAVGKISFSVKQIEENAIAFVESVVKAKPPVAKGNYIQGVTIASSMNPGLKLESSVHS
jgi:large subunit ribosomal protein L1